MTEEISWDEAVASEGFVKLESDKEKILVLTNQKLERVEKFGKEVVEFQADVLEEDGKAVEKVFGASSKRLKTKLRAIFENKNQTDKTKISILRVGDRFDTQYSVKEIKA
jgi:hypothetical protein